MPLRGIDLFCGAGGGSWGATAAGVKMVGAVDQWDIATATYSDNFPGATGSDGSTWSSRPRNARTIASRAAAAPAARRARGRAHM
jgi:site-specific DNA-cytosine methylase